MSKHGSDYNEQVIERLELLLNKEGQILTEDAEDYLRSVVKKATETERDRIREAIAELPSPDGEMISIDDVNELIYKEV